MANKSHKKAGQDAEVFGAMADVLSVVNETTGYEVQNRFTGDMPEVIPTGFQAIDDLTKIGGIPKGQLTQIYGEPSMGKSAFALHMIAQAQKHEPDRVAILFDTEGTYTHQRGKQHGVNTDRLILIQGNTAEEKFNQAIIALRTGKVSIIVVDSWGALLEAAASRGDGAMFKQEADGSFKSKRTVAPIPRLTTQFLQSCVEPLFEHKTAFLIVDQNRSKIGVVYGDDTTRTGGKYKGFAIVIELRVRVVEMVKSIPDGDADGIKMAFTSTKNKYGPVSKTVDNNHPTIWFGDEARKMGEAQEMVNSLLRFDLLTVNGTWLYWKVGTEHERKWQGKGNMVRSIIEDSELRAKFEGLIATKEKVIGTGARVSQEPTAKSDDN